MKMKKNQASTLKAFEFEELWYVCHTRVSEWRTKCS